MDMALGAGAARRRTLSWSSRVMPSPMADFMRRDRDGSTLIGGKISLLCICEKSHTQRQGPWESQWVNGAMREEGERKRKAEQLRAGPSVTWRSR